MARQSTMRGQNRRRRHQPVPAVSLEPLEDRRLLSGVAEAGDEPPLPVISVDPVTITEGDSGTSIANFQVTLSQASEHTVTVEYFTVAGTASSGSDYAPASGTVVLLAGETSYTVSITVNGDTTPELDEAFLLRFINPANATLAAEDVTGTILNDDGPVPDVNAPEAITGLAVTPADGQVSLSWTNPADPDLAGVLIVRRPNLAIIGGPNSRVIYQVGQSFTGGVVVVHAGVSSSFIDTGLVNGTTYHYSIYTYNAAGDYSPVTRTAATPLAPIPPDTIAPAAKLARLASVKPGKAPYRFKVAYTDPGLVNAATIWNRDILITGPRKYKQWVRLVSKNSTVSAPRIVATYQMKAPGRTWGPEDNARYTLWLWPGQVTDASGNPAAKKKLGILKVALKGEKTARKVAAAPARAAQADVRSATSFVQKPIQRDGLFNTKTMIFDDVLSRTDTSL